LGDDLVEISDVGVGAVERGQARGLDLHELAHGEEPLEEGGIEAGIRMPHQRSEQREGALAAVVVHHRAHAGLDGDQSAGRKLDQAVVDHRTAHSELARQLPLRGEPLSDGELPGEDQLFEALDEQVGKAGCTQRLEDRVHWSSGWLLV
jgi:hypothetical protein